MKQNKNKTGSSEEKEKNKEKDFPGYPHYKKNEDIMNSPEEARIDVDMEDVSRSSGANPVKTKSDNLAAPEESATPQTAAAETLKEKAAINFTPNDDDVELVEGTDADLTEDEIDELERDGVTDHNFHPNELDIPGAELDDEKEEIGEEDEENNYYSLGGDDKENLEENGKE